VQALMEIAMTSDRWMKRACWILGAALALAAMSTFAATNETPSANVPEGSTKDAMAALPRDYPLGETGVRNAAAQGPEALRRYIWRTRMIYNYYFPDFASRKT
jgi:hypothetical protein